VLVMVLAVLAVVLIVVAGVYAAGRVARGKLADQTPAPGKMITSGDHRLHVYCQGTGPVTVLFEAGLNNFSVFWREIQSRLAAHTQSCSYDRAGLGWSELSHNPASLGNMVGDLNKVVTAIAPNSPLVLVGHSFGGVLVRAYAQQYPNNIKALVLLDPANEFMADRIVGYREVLAKGQSQFNTLALLAAAGLIALDTNGVPSSGLSNEALTQYRAVLAFGEFFHGAAKETAQMYDNLQAMKKIGENEINKWPVTIISRGGAEPIPGLPQASEDSLEKTWAGLQADLVSRLGAKQIIAEKCGHHIQLCNPTLVYDTILPLIAGVD